MSQNQFNYLYKFVLRHKGKNLKTLAWLVKSIDILPFEAKYTYYWFPRNRIDTNKLPNIFSFWTVQLHLWLLIVMTKNRWHSSLCTASSTKKWRGPLSNFILEESGRLCTGYDIVPLSIYVPAVLNLGLTSCCWLKIKFLGSNKVVQVENKYNCKCEKCMGAGERPWPPFPHDRHTCTCTCTCSHMTGS